MFMKLEVIVLNLVQFIFYIILLINVFIICFSINEYYFPGTMIEWGNNWARAINYRRNNDEAFAAFFSQIGRLYNVHHIWCKNFSN